uniref:ADP-ribosyl cyclase/cyclic ADP-ribose hydrolase n=1 Tax=Arabidopsis thaliana TaxID=3702 RepID=A0A0S2RR82_ARATH|nr:TIR-NBS-LRR disease resistance protein RPP1 [Arabidopsis thaliana]
MGSAMSLSCSKRKATSQDVDSESCKRRKICSTNDAENCRFIPDESSWSLCANRVISVAAVALTKFRFQQDNQESNSSSLSLPSPATSVSRNWKHDVFPSFHGADVRRTFLSHILESFRRKGIDPFIDNNIERSKSIGPELKEAIQGSKIAIVLLSKNYASSSWCLDELAEIMKCREVLGQIVMTIFYEVDPTDIKKQTGEFGKAFTKTCKGKPKEHVERWRKALEDVATIAGYHSHSWRNEADMIEKIATDVSNMLNSCTPSRDFDGLVGMRAHMDRMEHLLRLDLDEVRMIGIWGPPGIGKTTIARFLLNQVSDRFQLSAIMVNIKGCYPRPCFDEYSAQLQLQNQMLSQMINHKGIMISHLGVAQERLRDKKVFLVLDEVDQLGQLDALAKETRWFGPGSRIIITTEDLGVLKAHGINHVYKVGYPSNDEAFQIFCMNAFGQKQPHEGFWKLAREVTYLAGELPLGLKVLGSALRGMSKPEWERTLPRLKTSLDGKIGSIIQFSYDGLCDEDKYLFLYIACLFNHESTFKVKELLGKFLDVRQGLHVLAQKSLISFYGDTINMHTLLRQFGRETSRKQFVHHGFTKRQLLVGERDICEVLSDDTIDSRRFIGINLDLYKNEEELNISEKALERVHDFQFVRINSIHQPERLLDLIYHSPKIRLLNWSGYQSICLPSTFNPEFLVELDMSFSKLQKLWEGTKQLRNLKWMNLIYSRDLKELPNLSTATNLEELNLTDCSSLVELPSSIEKLTSLQRLYLCDCSSLVELPSFGNATNLQELNLRRCTSLVRIHSSIENATNLRSFTLCDCSNLVELPSFGNATKLEILDLENCSSLVKLPPSINANNLQVLSLRNCSRVVELPAIENATNLRELKLQNCSSLIELPLSIGTATNLKQLKISGCSSLVKLPSSIEKLTNLQRLYLQGCSSLVELPSFGNATKLEILDLENCSSLEKLPPSINANNRQELSLRNCSSLVELPAIENATNLRELKLQNCSSLIELPPSIGTATNLEILNISGCSSLEKLPSSIGDMTNLKEFDLSNCSSLVELPAIENATNLRELKLQNCSSLIELSLSIGTATNLKKLNISGCSSLEKLPSSIGDMTNLDVLDLSNWSSLVELPSSIGNLQKLSQLLMSGCSKLEALPTNINLKSLDSLNLTDCSRLKLFPEISTHIKYLMLTRTAIKEVPLSITSWSRLAVYKMSYFESLKKFPHALDIITELVSEDIQEVPPWVKRMSRLRALRLNNCNNLVSLPQLSNSLAYIYADNCKSLERLDCCFNNPEISLYFPNCFKLNQEARDLIMHTSTRNFAMLPGTQVPACFNHRATSGDSLKIKLKESPLPTTLRFKACIMLVKVNEELMSYDILISMGVKIDIKDEQKGLKVQCTPRSIYPLLTEHIYTFELEVEEVTSTELVFEFTPYPKRNWKIGECGILQRETRSLRRSSSPDLSPESSRVSSCDHC